jgi:hypothetical protein
MSTLDDQDYLFTYHGVRAWGHAHHMQFVAKRADLFGKLPPSNVLVDNAKDWDRCMDNQGFLRMTTYERTVYHIGNVLGGELVIGGKNERLVA